MKPSHPPGADARSEGLRPLVRRGRRPPLGLRCGRVVPTDGTARTATPSSDGRLRPDVPSYEAVVFDMDGVLLTMTDGSVIDRAVREAFAAFDAEPTDEAVDPFVRADADGLARACEPHGLDPDPVWEAREWAACWLQAREMDAGRKRPYEDVADAFDALDALDARVGLVSNNQHHTVGYALDLFGLDGSFETAYGRGHTVDALRRRKPEPHYLDRALSDLGTRDALYVGDSGVDVEAAARADVDSAFVRRDHRADYRLPAEPDYEVADLAALVDLLGD